MQDSGLSIEEVVSNFYELKQQKKLDDDAFNDEKQEFYDVMDRYFESKEAHGATKITLTVGYDDEDNTRAIGGEYTVTRCCKRNVVFDVAKLRHKLSKKKFKAVSKTTWSCFDIDGLAKYVKSLGGEFDVFKSFFNVTTEVDESEVNRLSEIGEVTAEDIEGCYSVNEGKPWYKVSFKAAEDDEER